MKKLLLLAALAMTVSAQSFAQEKSTRLGADVKAMKAEGLRAAVAPVNALKRVEKANAGMTAIKRAPKKVMADEVWYQRPEGTMYVSGSGYIYPFIPPFITTTWANMATDKANSEWSFVGSSAVYPMHDYDGQDFEMDFPKISNGYISTLYVPHLSVGDIDYHVGSEFENVPDQDAPQVALINGDSLNWSVSQVNRHGGFWTGFSNGYVFGTDTRTFVDEEENEFEGKVDAIYEFYQKPIAPLYLSSFYLYSVTQSDVMIPEGTDMTLSIYKVEDGQIGDLIEEMTFNMADTVYYDVNDAWDGENQIYKAYSLFEVKKVETDAFGSEFQVPVIINDAFVVIISGFDQEGVDFSLYMCDVMATESDYFENTGWVEPTCRSFVRADNGEPIGGLRYCQYIDSEMSKQYNEEDGDNYDWRRQYNAGILLNCLYDIVKPIEGFETMIAPVEGGDIFYEEEVTEEDDDGNEVTETYRFETVQFYTSLPYTSTWEGLEGMANYEVVDLPDWLEVDVEAEETTDGWIEKYYYAEDPETENDPNVLLVAIKAQPLPDGMNGRTGTFRVVSERGADSGLITVVQGEAESQSIVTVSKGAAVKAQSNIYNLNGQRISGNYKGLVVRDGKKMFVK